MNFGLGSKKFEIVATSPGREEAEFVFLLNFYGANRFFLKPLARVVWEWNDCENVLGKPSAPIPSELDVNDVIRCWETGSEESSRLFTAIRLKMIFFFVLLSLSSAHHSKSSIVCKLYAMNSGLGNCKKGRLHVKSFDIQFEIHWNDDTEPILSILPHLKPGVLEKIRIKMDVDFSDQMKKVVKLEQWKQAIELDMRKTHFEIPLENLTHFKRFSVFIPKITEEQVISIKETLFKSTNFESCTLNYYEDELNLDYIQSKLGPNIQDDNVTGQSLTCLYSLFLGFSLD
ncbi:hypothetical protein GCK72_021215 [Caenorhabditis remanei]|uniref:DUF38 domain-containing protein n=1 Tax=Caenorhabditis remanei TaxID=31234 RepID=A0A6A5GJH6_CAERE|nr:hypothetical protein GCK72_021215 [Caenorhabditis remanei]KAF1754652.1 hypothetical protein GCK72_021215 [Caenorhabditis remanei]